MWHFQCNIRGIVEFSSLSRRDLKDFGDLRDTASRGGDLKRISAIGEPTTRRVAKSMASRRNRLFWLRGAFLACARGRRAAGCRHAACAARKAKER